MGNRLLVSGGNALREYAAGSAALCRHTVLEGSGALCAQGNCIICACGQMIWRLDAQSLMPTALFAGGPGICSLALSQDGRMLYALCAEADSLLALCSRSGAPQIINRAGVNPRMMALDDGVIAVAGGESASALLFCAGTLDCIAQLPMPGSVQAVALHKGNVYALCCCGTQTAALVTVSKSGLRETLALCGAPGALLAGHGGVLAATHGRLYRISPEGGRILDCMRAPGRADALSLSGGCLWLVDPLDERLYRLTEGRWQLGAEDARFAVSGYTASQDGEG